MSIQAVLFSVCLVFQVLGFPLPASAAERSKVKIKPSTTKDGKMSKPKKFLLITGCSRSGTTYISEALSKCGLDFGHEIVGRDGCSSWFMCVDDKAAPWKDRPSAMNFDFEHIFHQVRHPLDVISSVLATEHPIAVNFFVDCLPEINASDARIVKCAKFWYHWNLKAEQKAEWRYQIEQLEDVWDEMGQRLGLSLDPEILKTMSPQTNHRPRKIQLSWQELKEQLPEDLFIKIQEMAVRYGYSIEE